MFTEEDFEEMMERIIKKEKKKIGEIFPDEEKVRYFAESRNQVLVPEKGFALFKREIATMLEERIEPEDSVHSYEFGDVPELFRIPEIEDLAAEIMEEGESECLLGYKTLWIDIKTENSTAIALNEYWILDKNKTEILKNNYEYVIEEMENHLAEKCLVVKNQGEEFCSVLNDPSEIRETINSIKRRYEKDLIEKEDKRSFF